MCEMTTTLMDKSDTAAAEALEPRADKGGK